MTESITNSSLWKPGQSGNPKGRPPKNRVLSELLRQKGKETVVIDGVEKSAQEIVTAAVWQLAKNGEVWLAGRRLAVESVTEWAGIVKWLFNTIEPPTKREGDDIRQQMVVQVVYEDRNPVIQTQLIDAEYEIED